MARPFVLSALQRILFVSQNRLEMRSYTPNPSQKTLWASRLEMSGWGLRRENCGDTDWLKVLD
jgi:hypothetical protein